MRVSDILASKGGEVFYIAENATLEAAVREMDAHGIGALLVMARDGRLLGVLSEREIIVSLARQGVRALKRMVAELVSPGAATLSPQDSVQQAMRVMTERRARHVPVVVDTQIVGLLSVGDIVKSRLSEKIAEVAVLQDLSRMGHAA